jgi:phosphatidylserine/phosphatidylglycerophosphate/cardiolipin synthase-like enzyme
MSQKRQSIAILLGLLTTACSMVPAPTMMPATRSEDGAAIRSLALTESAGLFKELGATGETLDPAKLTAEDVRAFDTDGDRKVDREEVAAAMGKLIQAANAAEPIAQPTQPAQGQTMPSFFVNPNPQPNDTELFLDDNEIFPELFRLINGSQKRIQISYFLLGGDIGMSIAKAMVDRAKAGVDIQIMLDPKLGLSGAVADGIARVINYLKQNKVGYKLYPLALYGPMPNRIQDKFQINHNKIAVFDEKTAFVGSMNLDDLARINHDLMVRVTGPSATELSDMLDNEWSFGLSSLATNTSVPLVSNPTAGAMPSLRTQAAGTMRFSQTAPQQRNTRENLLAAINGAQRSIHLTMYEFGDVSLATALGDAYRRGVDVRVILEPKGDALKKYGAGILPDGMPNVLPAREILKAGAQVHWFKGWRAGMELHMKAVAIDGKTLIAGSTNWTTNAFTRWRETSFYLEGATVDKFEAEFDRLWSQSSTRIDRLTLKQRLTARLVEYMNRKDIAFW